MTLLSNEISSNNIPNLARHVASGSLCNTFSTKCSIPIPEALRAGSKHYISRVFGKQNSRLSFPLDPVSEMCSYGQHAPSSSFQQDSALVAQFASQDHFERDHHALASSDIPEEFTAWNDTICYESRPKNPTLGRPMHKEDIINYTNERAPLLPKPSVSGINEAYEDSDDDSNHDRDYRRIFFNEVKTLARYTLPVFGFAPHFFSQVDRSHSFFFFFSYYRTHILEVFQAVRSDVFVLTVVPSIRSSLLVPSPLATSPPRRSPPHPSDL